jgi:hypothetical protein
MSQSGYIALISAVIISFLIMGIALTLSLTSFFNRSDLLDSEFKEMSGSLSEACVSTALLKIAQNESYAGNESVVIGDYNCSILPLESAGGQKIVKTSATVQNSTTNFKVIIDQITLQVISWEEIPAF